MGHVEVDSERLMASADRFDEQAARCTALVDRFSGIVDNAVSGRDPDTAILQSMQPMTNQIKDGLRELGEFCRGMAKRVRAAARNYAETDETLVAESNQVLASVTATIDRLGGSTGKP